MYHSMSNYLALMRDPAMTENCLFCFNEEIDAVTVHGLSVEKFLKHFFCAFKTLNIKRKHKSDTYHL